MPGTQQALTVERVAPDSLVLDPGNARQIDEPALDALERSIHEFGFIEPVVARREDRVIIGAHQRVEVALRAGLETFDLDAAIKAATTTSRSKPGDVWRIGDHRLLHGDATSADDIARVLGGAKAAMTFTDPPDNVDHGGAGTHTRRIANDAMAPEGWERFVRDWATTILGASDGACYICTSGKERATVSGILSEAGRHRSTTIIWAKDRFTLGRSDYQRGYEPIRYWWQEGAGHHWCGDRDQSDVWEIERPASSPLHPTMKPSSSSNAPSPSAARAPTSTSTSTRSSARARPSSPASAPERIR